MAAGLIWLLSGASSGDPWRKFAKMDTFRTCVAVPLSLLLLGAGRPSAPDVQALPENGEIGASFSGSNVYQIYTMLSEADERAKKGDFETSKEHELRTSDLNKSLYPLDPNKEYAFPVKGAVFSYNPDLSSWSIKTSLGDGCEALNPNGDLFTCPSVYIHTEKSGYVGQNSFGATTNVRRRHVLGINYITSKTWMDKSRTFRRGVLGQYFIDINFEMPIDEAKKTDGHQLKLYAVGKIIAPFVDRKPTIYDAPTVANPVERKTDIVTLGLLPTRFIVVSEGRAGVQREFQIAPH